MYYITGGPRDLAIIYISQYALSSAYPKDAIGPYFTYKEAMAVLYYWTK